MLALFFDTETTGLKREDFTPEIVQIAAILQDTESKRIYAEINLIVSPVSFIPEPVAQIHGIDTELARAVGVSQTIADQTFARMAECADVLVAHNIDFDTAMVYDNWPLSSAAIIELEQYCTMRKLTDIIKLPPGEYHHEAYTEFKPPRLHEAYSFFFGKKLTNAHNAMQDVQACRDIYFAAHERLL